jgi:[protein-PII] uridylyltransferase
LFETVDNRRAIIDRRSVSDALAAVPAGKKRRGEAARILEEALEKGRGEIARRLSTEPGRGRIAARATAFLHDQIVRVAHDFLVGQLLDEPPEQPVAIVGLGGTGRGEMAPFSDLDLMFLTARKPSPEQDQLVESLLLLLWDLKLKLGHSLRSTDELLALAKSDMTVRTAFLEARLIWGDEAVFEGAMQRFRTRIVAGSAAEFVAAKLAERDQRHKRMGDSRYVVEPNVKDGKGGLRDLHTLYWIGKYVHGVDQPADLVRAGLFSAAEFRRFDRSASYGRCAATFTSAQAAPRSGSASTISGRSPR